MAATGRLSDRCIFAAPVPRDENGPPSDALGNAYVAWVDVAGRWGDFRPTLGREAIRAGREQESAVGTLRVRQDSVTRTITTAMKVTISTRRGIGAEYVIRSIIDPDQRGAYLEMLVERGPAT